MVSLVTKHGDNSPFTDDFMMIVPLRPLCLQSLQWISEPCLIPSPALWRLVLVTPWPPAEESTDIHQGWGHFWGHFGYERLSIIQKYPPSFKVQF